MVTVIDYAVRSNSEGEDFIALLLQGDLEMVQSQDTGNFYATARKCYVTSTFDERTADNLIGQQMPGKIVRKACDPYDYTIESGEVLKLDFTWAYVPEGDEPRRQKQDTPHVPVQTQFSGNGVMAEA